MDQDKLPTELQLVLPAYVYKKNLTISFVSLKEAKMRELSLLYDTAQADILQLLMCPSKEGPKIDVLCNQFEYEIIYKSAYPIDAN